MWWREDVDLEIWDSFISFLVHILFFHMQKTVQGRYIKSSVLAFPINSSVQQMFERHVTTVLKSKDIF